jgi:hypothetical protein
MTCPGPHSMSKKRSLNSFIKQDLEQTIRQTEKKLTDIFTSTKRFGNKIERIDESEKIDWMPLMNNVLEIYKKRHQEKLAASHLIPIWKKYTREFIASTRIGGDKRLQDLYNQLSFFDKKYQRSMHQIEFHRAFIASCLRNIYGSEFSPNFLRILQENELQEARQEVFICCPRRFGKTFAVGLFCAAYLLTQPEQRICIFSPSRRQSKMILDLIVKFIRDDPRGPDMICKQNQEELWLRGPTSNNDMRILCSYPSRVQVCVSRAPLCFWLHPTHPPTSVSF